MIFDALVVGHVRANLSRALVSILAIALGVATALALRLAGSLTLATLDSDRALFTSHLDFQILPYAEHLPDRVYADVRYVDGVASAAPIIDRPFVLGVDRRSGTGGTAARLLGVDLLQQLPGVTGFDEGRPGPFAPTGSFIDPQAVLGANGAIVSESMARRYGLRKGSHIDALAAADIVPITIANILPARAQGVDSSVVFVDVTTAQRMFHEPGAVDRVDVVTNESPEIVRPRISRAVGDRARLVAARDGEGSLANLTGGIEATLGALAAIALVLGGLLVFNAVGTSITQRRGDIGTLRALGVAPHQIVVTFVIEGAAYGAIGAMLGVGIGAYAVDAIAQITHATYTHGAYDVWPFFGAFGMGVAIAVVSSLGPALAAVGIAPAVAARRGAAESANAAVPPLLAAAAATAFAAGTALAFHPSHDAAFVLGFPLCFALGGALAIPAILRLVAPLSRRATADAPPAFRFAAITLGTIPKRIAIAIGALAVAVYAAVAFDIASVSFQTALESWATHGIAGDLIVRPAGADDGERGSFEHGALVRTQATPGVLAVEGVRTLQTTVGRAEVGLRGDDAFVPVPHARSTEAPAQIGSSLAAALHVRRGDAIEVRAPHRTLRLRLVEVRPDFSSGANAIVVTRGLLHDAFGDDRIDALRVTLAAGADVATVRTAISRALAPRRLAIVTTRELRERLIGVFGGTFDFARALGSLVVAIAVLGVASALAGLVFERSAELRMLRRLGASRRTLASMLVVEAFAIATLGSILGLALGIALAALQLGVSDAATLGFPIPMTIPFERVAFTILASVAAATLGSLLSLPAAFGIATDAVSQRAR